MVRLVREIYYPTDITAVPSTADLFAACYRDAASIIVDVYGIKRQRADRPQSRGAAVGRATDRRLSPSRWHGSSTFRSGKFAFVGLGPCSTASRCSMLRTRHQGSMPKADAALCRGGASHQRRKAHKADIRPSQLAPISLGPENVCYRVRTDRVLPGNGDHAASLGERSSFSLKLALVNHTHQTHVHICAFSS